MIRLENTSIAFSGKPVISDLSFSIGESEHVAVLGKNGSGKSSLALYLAGVIPDLIEAQVGGKKQVPEKTALILQNPSSQFFALSVEQELGKKPASRFEMNSLWDKSVFELSEGEKQKVNLVANLMNESFAILLDEPLELLDPQEANRFQTLVEKEKEKTVVWFDKDERFVKNWKKIPLSPLSTASLSKPRLPSTGKTVLHADFSVSRESFHLNASFSLSENEKIAFIGKNGSGKTTLLKALAGIFPVFGTFSSSLGYAFVPQNPGQILFESTVEDVAAPGRLAELGITAFSKRHPLLLSKGEQKIVSLAATPHNSVLLLDEPTTWLDAERRKNVYGFISGAFQPMIIATHDEELLQYCHRIFLVENGGIKECSASTAIRFFHPIRRN